MKSRDEDRLLREILADESVERVRRVTLAAGLAVARGRRRSRMVTMTALGCVACVALTFALVARHQRSAGAAPVAPATSPVPATSTVKWIDDAQLLSRFPDRGVALIGRSGEQHLVFLDSNQKL